MDFQEECLAAHNEYRKLHGVPPLKLDKELCKVAQQWANHLSNKNLLEHSNNENYGENLFCMTSSNPNFTITGKKPVESWYSEIKDHVFGKEPTSLASGHFTQVVWKESAKLGVAFAKNGGRIVVVANYDPPGNYVGCYTTNVPPVGSFSRINNNNNNENYSNNISKPFLSNGTKSDVKTASEGNFEEDCLKAHNEYRKLHGVPPLKLDKELCKVAQNWANHLSNRNLLEHSGNKNYGENLFCMTSSNPNFTITGKKPVESWYSEIKDHIFVREPTSLASGHFTQVVWKESTKLGVAFAKNGGRIVVVANYDPPGNYVGCFAKNVPPVGGFSGNNNDSKEICSDSLSKLSLSNSNNNVKNATEGNFTEDFLNAHNEYRKRHGVKPLQLDKNLCKYSEEWAKHLAEKNILEHRPDCDYGENIYCLTSSNPSFTISGNTPVDHWYEEVQYHPFGREPTSLKSGHFTQVVWKSSEFLGVGVAKNSHGTIYVVANYSPAGNYERKFVENVLPLTSEQSKKEKVFLPESTNEQGFTQFALDGLKVHNEYRRKHGVPDLKLNKQMCDHAQDWADTCARSEKMSHRPNNPYGENVFCVYSSDLSHVPSARDAVKEWYDEIKKHTFGVESVKTDTLHFTQIVWKKSTELGFAMAKNKKGETYVVANYNPRGNYVGQFVDNVPKPRF